MRKFILTAAYFSLMLFCYNAKADVKDAVYYYKNIDEAREILNGRCASYNLNIENPEEVGASPECLMIRDVVIGYKNLENKNTVINALQKKKEELEEATPINSFEDKMRLRVFKNTFSEQSEDHDDFVASCLQDKERAKLNPIECIASLAVMIEKLEKARDEFMPEFTKEDKYREFYRSKFKESLDLDDNCRSLFEDPWYESDPYRQDVQCNVQIREYLRTKKLYKTIEGDSDEEDDSVVKKDAQYFENNKNEAKEVVEQCYSGDIESIKLCNTAMKFLEMREQEEREAKKYNDFYSNHIMAARYHLRWCYLAMLPKDFDVECKIVQKIAEGRKDKVLDDSKYNSFYEFFKKSPLDAGVVVKGECADLITDSWYFLDINMQTEKCNAAMDITGRAK